MSNAYPDTQYTRDEDVPVPAGFRELEENEIILATDQVYDHHLEKWVAVTICDTQPGYTRAGINYKAERDNSTIRHTGKPASLTRDEKRPVPVGFRELEEEETVLVTDLVHDEVSVSGVSWLPQTALHAADYRLKAVGNGYHSAQNRQRIRATSIYTASTATTAEAPAPAAPAAPAPAADVFPPAIPPPGWRYARIGDKLEAGRLDLAAYLRKKVSPGTSRVEPSNRTDLITADLFAATQGPDSLGVFLIKDDRPALPDGYRYLNPGDVIQEGDEYLDRYFPGQGADLTGRWVRSLWADRELTSVSATYRRRVAPAVTQGANLVAAPAVGDGYRVMLVGEIPVTGDEFWNSCTARWQEVLPFSASVPLTGLGRYRRKLPTALESALAGNAALIQQLIEADARVSTLDRTNAQLEASLKIRDGRVDVLEILLRQATDHAAKQTTRADTVSIALRLVQDKVGVRDELIEDLNERLAYKEAAAKVSATTYTVPAFSAKPYYYSGIVADVQDQGARVIAGGPWVGKTPIPQEADDQDARLLDLISSLRDEVDDREQTFQCQASEINRLNARIQQFESNQVKWHAFWAAFRDLHAIDFHISGCADQSAHQAYGRLRRAFDDCTTNPGGRT